MTEFRMNNFECKAEYQGQKKYGQNLKELKKY